MGTALRREFMGGGLDDPLFIEAVGTILTGHVVRRWSSRPSVRSMKGQLSPGQIRRTLDAIESWMPSGIRISGLANQLGMGTHKRRSRPANVCFLRQDGVACIEVSIYSCLAHQFR